MTRQSEQLEREAEGIRSDLIRSVEELRARVTPGQVVDEIVGYVREGPIAEFIRNLGREVKENPLPLLLIGAGTAWAMIASSLRKRSRVPPVPEMPARTSEVEARPKFPLAAMRPERKVAPTAEAVE